MLKKILVPIDGSSASIKALEYAMKIGTQYKAAILALAVTPPYGYADLPLVKERTVDGPDQKAARLEKGPVAFDRAKEVTKDYAGTVDFLEITDRDVPGTICKKAKLDESDLIVIGSTGLGRISGILLGSVSTSVAAEATCPVVVIK